MTDIKVARLRSTDGPDGIDIAMESVPSPGPGEVALSMAALGLNRAEAMFARGEYIVAPSLPSRLGIEGVGVVREIGAGVEGIEVGQRLAVASAADVSGTGLLGEVVTVPASMLLPDLPTLSDVELAAFWIAFITAYGGLVQQGGLAAGESVLVSAASSSVGLAAIQVAKVLGARVVATTRTSAKVDRLLQAGADRVVVTDVESLDDLGEPLDLVFDAVGAPILDASVAHLRAGGRFVIYGVLSGERTASFPLIPAVIHNLRMTAFHAGFHVLADSDRRHRAIDWLTTGVNAGHLSPTVHRVFALDQLADAYRHLEGSTQVGKIVVRVGGQRPIP